MGPTNADGRSWEWAGFVDLESEEEDCADN